MLGIPEQNSTGKHRNRTLMEIVRCMMSYFSLLKILWCDVLRAVTYALNQGPSNFVPKTPYELMYRKRRSFYI